MIKERYDARGDRWIWKEYLAKQGVNIASDLEQVLNKLLARLAIHRYETAAQALRVIDPSRVVIPNVSAGGSASSNIPSTQKGNTQVVGNPPPQPQQGLFGMFQQLFGAETNTSPQQPLPTQKSPPRQPVVPPQNPVAATPKSPAPAPQSPQMVYQNFVENLGRGVKLEMIAIPLGSFKDEEGNIVKITEPFYMGKYQVTQAQWQAVMGNTSRFKGKDLPVERISWNDCQKFIKRLNNTTGESYSYRLPSEAEWEYCCRAVMSEHVPVTDYCFGNDVSLRDQYAWYYENSGSKTHVVGQKKPNQFGLYDMHGNVWEWCEDSWSDNYQKSRIQKHYKDTAGTGKALRGGSWIDWNCHSMFRNGADADISGDIIGFRLACVGSRISP